MLRQPTGRPSLDRQTQSSSSTSSTTTSSRQRSQPHSGSVSSTSSKSLDDSRRPAKDMIRSRKTVTSPEASAPRGHSRRTSSSSSIPQLKGSLDSALGIHLDRGITESPADIQVAQAMENPRASPVIYPELDRYRDVRRPANSSEGYIDIPFRLATQDLPPPTPGSVLFSGTSAASASPSTRFSESPGLGTYSRDTTPTSVSSQSPSLTAPYRPKSSKSRHNSPAQSRPPVSRRRAGGSQSEYDVISADPHGLAAVRESLTSSSSNSTVRDAERSVRDRKSSRTLPAPPLSPPPRKSSQKFHNDLGGSIPPPKRSYERPTSPMASPPSRPSRDGTPDMQSHLPGPAPIIRSNLSSSSLPTERRGSEPTIPASISKPGVPISDKKNASVSRLPLGRDVSSASQTSLANDVKKTSKAEVPRPTRTPSPHVGSAFSRFPFFGRKKASTDGSSTKDKEKEKDKKTLRKGPAAGTGHEGYGRIGGTRRRSASTMNLPRGPSSGRASQESLGGGDSFLTDRIKPVVISGGGNPEKRNHSFELSRTGSEQSLMLPRPSADSVAGSVEVVDQSVPQSTLWPSPMSRAPRAALNARRPSESSDEEGIEMKPTLALRRSMHRLGSSSEIPLRLPQPINTSGNAPSPMTSFDTSVMSDDSHIELQKEVSRGRDPAHPAPKKLVKRARSPSKWNLFNRSQNKARSTKSDNVAATVQVTEKKPVAFYTIMDSSEQDDGETMDVQEVLRNANVYGDSPNMSSTDYSGGLDLPAVSMEDVSAPEPLRLPERNNVQVSTPPQSFSQGTLVPSGNPQPRGPGRPSRLAQVGRIPKVVSHRTEEPSPKSFSRPFRASLQLPPPVPIIHDLESIAKGPSPPSAPDAMPDAVGGFSAAESEAPVSVPALQTLKPSPDLSRLEKEFIAFSPRKGSEDTNNTSCSSCSGNYAFASATAIIPQPDDPPAEDEIWDEYDDLIGEDNQRVPLSATSSKGMAFHLDTYQSRFNRQKPMESPTIILDDRKASIYSKATTRSSSYSADMTERIRKAFQPHASPQASVFVPGPVPGTECQESQQEEADRPRDSARSSGSSHKGRKSDASFASSNDGSPLAQVNLRVGSMTVSKWLTFGHVLFSDVRHELGPVEDSAKRQSILVIDGLGNDDWSFYAAETYPSATFYNLSPRAPLPAEVQNSSSSFPLSPPNHHQIQYLSPSEKFPFAPQSFTAMVYRFPVAAPESHYRNILTEARRVLKPGGYLELSILDVDLNNMGNQGRRTIRQLKERVHDSNPETNLSSTADLIIRLLGKVGFSNIKAARVGVPVSSAANPSKGQAAKKKDGDPPSLAEMMKDNGPKADEGIGKMVGRVGRWWYTRCYESAAAESPNGKSMWENRDLLSECNELGTSLKLMVCCARAPDRVASL